MRTETCSVISSFQQLNMNSLEILKILKSDAFIKTVLVFTDVLPIDRLPDRIQTRPRGFIVNTDPADKPGTTG